MSEEKTISIKIPKFGFKFNLWIFLTVILAVVLVLSLVNGWSFTGKAVTTVSGSEMPINEAADKSIAYINNNLVQPGSSITYVSSEDLGSVYMIVTSYQGREIPIYVSRDGSMLFLTAYNTSVDLGNDQPSEEPEEVPKTNKPVVDLFVMSFCPYGVQAENLMKPVVDLFGTKADINIRYIASVQGDTVDTVQSLHGITEAQEDLRQLCIMKYYDQETFWEYLTGINTNCYGKIDTKNATALEICWKNAATAAGIDVAKIQTCSSGAEGLNLLKADEALGDQYSVTGSPTILINGVKYTGTRSAEAFKQAICSAFTTSPSECGETLSTSGGTSTGGC